MLIVRQPFQPIPVPIGFGSLIAATISNWSEGAARPVGRSIARRRPARRAHIAVDRHAPDLPRKPMAIGASSIVECALDEAMQGGGGDRV